MKLWLKMPKHKRSDIALERRKETRIAVSVEILLRFKLSGGADLSYGNLPASWQEVYEYLRRSRRGEFVQQLDSGDQDLLIESTIKRPRTEQ